MLKTLVNADFFIKLLAGFLNCYCDRYGHTNHGVVTCADQAHHLFGQTAVESKKP